MYRIQKLLDHKDATMTQRYAKLSPDSSFDAVNSMFAQHKQRYLRLFLQINARCWIIRY
jgi:hypothetical protein